MTDNRLDINAFVSPQKKHGGLPFWAWNTHITDQKVEKQVEVFADMGFGGFVIHVRHGLMDEYMGEKFFKEVDLSIEKAKENGLTVWLYDEDRWPSGCAGGIVTRNKRYRQKTLYFTKKKTESFPKAQAIDEGSTYLLAAYNVKISPDGLLEACEVTSEADANLFAYVKTAPDLPRYNGQAYVDTMNDEAIRAFIDSTYEVYFEHYGDEFGKVIEAIFTDEPQLARCPAPSYSTFEKFTDAEFPFSDNFCQTYREMYGEELIQTLPEIVWDRADGALSTTRYRFNEHIAYRFRRAYSKQIGNWCREHKIAFTGHYILEESLQAQATSTRDNMRFYADMDIPGIDILRGNYEFTNAKQCQSVARQSGISRVMSELYGVTNWDADFRDYIHQGNWQAAMGITARVPHLTWMSMLGVGKRDYPATFGYQVPWYLEYPRVEDHFSRLNAVITAGKPIVRIGVIHPVESFWFFCGTEERTADVRRARDDSFHAVCEWLIFGGHDFDYISEALIPEQYSHGSVGQMPYDVILVPDCVTLRRTTLDMLSDMRDRGVKVIFAGGLPTHVDGIECQDAQSALKTYTHIPLTEQAILNALAPYRTYSLFGANGARCNRYIHQEREIDGKRFLFITPAKAIEDKQDTRAERLTLRLEGPQTPTLYDTFTGTARTPEYKYLNGNTEIYLTACQYDSFLIELEQKETPPDTQNMPKEERLSARIPHKTAYRLEEPNVCLLDMAEYSYDGELFEAEEEIIRIDRYTREKYSLPSIMGRTAAQPYSVKDDEKHSLWLRFTFESETVTSPALAFEAVEEIRFNGAPVSTLPCGTYVDDDFKTVRLPMTRLGENELLVRITVSKICGAEPMYLLGDFGVRLQGTEKTLTPAEREIGYGDITAQGLPFYGGSIVYSTQLDTPDGDIEIALTHYAGDLLTVSLDGKEQGAVILPPYRVRVNGVTAGRHTLEIRCFGNRHNTFGSLHAAIKDTYYGPAHWHKTGDHFTYEYTLRKMGVLRTPEITVIKK